jgi:sugar lactone lactonase YvrE
VSSDDGPLVVSSPWLQLQSVHGEGVVWDAARAELLFVDIPIGRIWRVDTATRDASSFDVPGMVGAVHPTVDGRSLVIADSDGIALCVDGAITRLASPLAEYPDVRMNDANVDPAGRYFAGSMALDERVGAATLYRLDLDGSLRSVVEGATISNGIDWSPDGRSCYYIDSPLRRVDVFDFDVETGAMSNRRRFVDVATLPGVPDGLSVDASGGVWVAFFGGARVCRFTPDGSLDVTVALPVSNVTSCCFGGADLRELYISTSTLGLSAEELSAQPAAGALFRAEPGFVGKPGTPFAALP